MIKQTIQRVVAIISRPLADKIDDSINIDLQGNLSFSSTWGKTRSIIVSSNGQIFTLIVVNMKLGDTSVAIYDDIL